ncbi:MAG: hypothetical protein A3G66_01010 [Candidatus Levybacteria bacterium RIFCSPLOWO2_12_FULL_39_17]|nr:MAG: Ribosomal protein S23 [Candidatus Levybacteria bacterium GW2011_GWA1_39_11]KKR27332.1 MAG: S23 ribosomal protein [Microgenomates group bacterium GW2011_GWC1_39_7]OGH45405.1 MAG: hypothetical protein A3H82_02200 [Candidatus Levybacteria bacterium RIFCSPLOWO2_02_FULL_39_26]OGH48007.1 MAG: hypothetical protein A3G66_01010 [Candidatus Levybacteria bacterium RIFCSPLOWO2_12_FULL_39_17]
MPSEKIKSFINLRAWQEAHKLVLLVYRSSAKFPKNAYSLIDQIRRAVISISSNIAEGFSRQSKKEKIQFYYISKGSLTEVQNLLLVSKDIKYLDQAEFKIIAEQTIVVHKLINGLIRSIKNSNSLDTKY